MDTTIRGRIHSLLQPHLGSSIERVRTIGFVFPSKEPELIAVELALDGVLPIVISAANDGWNIHVAHGRAERQHLGPYGRIEIAETLESAALQTLVSHNLARAWIVGSRGAADDAIGVRLEFEPLGRSFVFLNFGDDLYVGERYPPDLSGEHDELQIRGAA